MSFRRTFLSAVVIALTPIAGSFAADVTVKGKTQSVPVCGGFAGIECTPKEWCNFPAGSRCGLADQFGVCRPRPEICIELYLPVCGCNNQTYSNACKAHADGVDVYYPGPCR